MELKKAMEKAYGDLPRTSDVMIGPEQEILIVDEEGFSASFQDIQKLFSSMSGSWDPYDEDGIVVGMHRTLGKYKVEATTDLSSGQLELSIPPADSLDHAAIYVETLMNHVFEASQRAGLEMLMLGIHPRSRARASLVMPKQRYRALEKIFQGNKRLSPPNQDIHYMTLTAANQCHFNSSRKNMPGLLRVFNGFSPAMIALGANSSVWNGRAGKYDSVRPMTWKWGYGNRGKIGLAPDADNMIEYFESICNLSPVFVRRDGRTIMIDHLDTFGEFIENGAEGRELFTGEPFSVNYKDEDLKLHQTFAWFWARPSLGYGTIELRPWDQQPSDSILLPSAVGLGLAHNLGPSKDYLDQFTREELERAQWDAALSGLDATVGRTNILDMAQRMLDLAKEGLDEMNQNPRYLDPGYERLERHRSGHPSTPSRISLDVLERKGMEGLLSNSFYRPMSHLR